jgi:hypothetical protein
MKRSKSGEEKRMKNYRGPRLKGRITVKNGYG